MPTVKNLVKSPFVDAPGSRRGAQNFLRQLAKEDDPLAIVEKLGAHDLFIAFAEADDEQRSELLVLATADQFRSLLDLLCWRADMPDLVSLEEVVRPLVATGLEGAQVAFDKLEDELKTLLLKKYIVVHVREDKDDEVSAAEGSELIACSDGYYFIEIPFPDDLPDVVRQLMTGLINKPFEEYQRELECIRVDMVSELQESALKWRTGRLADLGFGTREEALRLLTPRDPAQVRRAVAQAQSTPHPLRSDIPVPVIFRENLDGSQLLDESIRLLVASDHPDYVSRSDVIIAELGALTSLFLVAVECDLSDVDAISQQTRWCRDLLTLGLGVVCEDDPVEGAKVLVYQEPAAIFQAAMGVLLPLRGRSSKVLAHHRVAAPESIEGTLDPLFAITLELLSRPIPARWPALEQGGDLSVYGGEPLPGELRAFSNSVQVRAAQQLVEEAEAIGGLVGGSAMSTTMIMTAAANVFHDRQDLFSPLSPRDAATFADAFLSGDEESSCEDAIQVLSDRLDIEVSNAASVDEIDVAASRLLRRLVWMGRARLAADAPEQVLLITEDQ